MASIVSGETSTGSHGDGKTHKLVPMATLVGHTDRVWSVDFSPDGTLLASCGGDKMFVYGRKNMVQVVLRATRSGSLYVCWTKLSGEQSDA